MLQWGTLQQSTKPLGTERRSIGACLASGRRAGGAEGAGLICGGVAGKSCVRCSWVMTCVGRHIRRATP